MRGLATIAAPMQLAQGGRRAIIEPLCRTREARSAGARSVLRVFRCADPIDSRPREQAAVARNGVDRRTLGGSIARGGARRPRVDWTQARVAGAQICDGAGFQASDGRETL